MLACTTSDTTFPMEGVELPHPAAELHQDDVNLHQAEPRGSQHGGPRRSPERREVQEGSIHTIHTTRTHTRGKSHVSHAKHGGNLQREIADLKRELRHARRERSPPRSEPSSGESDGTSYRRRSRTPQSETFSYEEERRHRRRRRSPTSRGLGNDAMNKALSQISKSPFTRSIDDATHPRRFNQPTFSLYDGHSDSVEHVSYYSQKMAIHSRDDALMCKIFLSSLGPTAMRWFNGLRANSVGSFKALTQAFGARFITCSRTPLPLGSLLTLSMREGETLKSYSDRYWKMFNEIGGEE